MTENSMLAARMTELGIGSTQLARALDISERTVSYWLSGKITWPNEPTRVALIRYLKVNNVHELGFIQPVRRYLGHTSYATALALDRGDRTGEAATDRRDAMRTGGMAIAGAVMAPVAHRLFSEPDHMAAALDAGSVNAERLAALERTTDQLATRANTLDKFSLLGEAVATFGTVRRLVRERQRTTDQVRLVRAGGKLALVTGEILFDMHEFTLAGRWYVTARSAALDVGDRELADTALATNASVPAYSGDPKGVLAMVGPRLETAPVPSPAVAFLWAAKARAHAGLGEADGFRRSIARSRSILDARPPDPAAADVFAFHVRRLDFYETTGRARLRDTAGTIEAGERTLRSFAATSGYSPTATAMVRLDQATVHAQDGEVGEACRLATTALTDDRTLLGASVLLRAREFDAVLGADTSPAVRDWRDVLHEARRRVADPHPALP